MRPDNPSTEEHDYLVSKPSTEVKEWSNAKICTVGFCFVFVGSAVVGTILAIVQEAKS